MNGSDLSCCGKLCKKLNLFKSSQKLNYCEICKCGARGMTCTNNLVARYTKTDITLNL